MTSLDLYRPVTPTPLERDLYHRAVRGCQSLGVRFELGQVAVRWFQGEDYEPRGVTRFTECPIGVWIRRGEFPDEEIVETIAHELKHCDDHLRYPGTLEKCEREQRAYAFAARVRQAEFGR